MIAFNSYFKNAGVLKMALFGAGFLFMQNITAQVSLTTFGSPYTQDFDMLSNAAGSTTNSLVIPGWFMTETGGGARDNELYAVDPGASTTGDTYSYGAAAATDRAFGSLRSGTCVSLIGASFTNNTGATIGALDISFYGEHWRLGTISRNDSLKFQYSLSATTPTSGVWSGVSALNFVSPTNAVVGAKDGNIAVNRTLLSTSITGLSIPNGATVWIRWMDIDVSGADDGMAIDDFTLTPQAATGAPEMDVQWNAVSIADGSAFPVSFNGTAFGDQSVCAGVITRTFVVLNTGAVDLNLSGSPIVNITGPGASDYTVTSMPASTITAGNTSSFVVEFNPSVAGSRSAIIEIANNDADENPYEFYILGNGVETSVTLDALSNVSCNGGTNGSIAVNATGIAPLSYSWEPVTSSTATLTGIQAGVYTVTITDTYSCQATETFTVSEPSALTLSVTVSSTDVCAGSSATLSATAGGGTGLISYTWSTSENTSDVVVTPTITSTYTLDIADANSCMSTNTISVIVNNEPVLSVNSGTICAGESFTITPSGADTYTISSGSFIVNPTNTSSYTVTGTSLEGCVNATGVVSDVIVNQLPSISVNSGAICSGQSFTMMPSGADTYTYSSGSDVVMPTTDATYTVTGTDANGCENMTTSTVTVNALPVMTAVTNNTLLCVGETATLSVTGAFTYTWNTSENTTDIAVSPTITTTYTVDGTDVNGCSNTTTITQDVSVCTGLTQMSKSTAISVYPNPSNGIFILELETESQIEVYDLLGNVVLKETMQSGKHNLNISEKASGIYILKTTANGAARTMRLVKKN